MTIYNTEDYLASNNRPYTKIDIISLSLDLYFWLWKAKDVDWSEFPDDKIPFMIKKIDGFYKLYLGNNIPEVDMIVQASAYRKANLDECAALIFDSLESSENG